MRLGLEALMGSDREEITIMSFTEAHQAALTTQINDIRDAIACVERNLGAIGQRSFRSRVSKLYIGVDCLAEFASDLIDDVTYHNAHHEFAEDAERLAKGTLAETREQHRARFISTIAEARSLLVALDADIAAPEFKTFNERVLALLKIIREMDANAEAITGQRAAA